MGNGQRTVMYFNHMSEFAGAEASLLELLKGLNRKRYRPVLICPGAGPLVDKAEALGVPVYRLPLFRLSYGMFRRPWLLWLTCLGFISGLFHVIRLLRTEAVDIVHVNSSVIIQPALAAWLTGTPLVWHVREYPRRRSIQTALSYVICKLADVVIVISQDVREGFRRSDKVRLVYNGVDLAAFDRAEPADGLPGATRVAVFGQLNPVKGQAEFLGAAQLLLREGHNVHFYVVGDALGATQMPYKHVLLDFVKHHQLSSCTTFLGHRSDIPQLMKAMDVIVVPSLYEPFGRVVIEGMAAGKPVVGSAVGGIPEIIIPAVTGLLVPPGDVTALAAAIKSLLGDAVKRYEYGVNGSERVRSKFSAHAYVDAIEKVYEELPKSS